MRCINQDGVSLLQCIYPRKIDYASIVYDSAAMTIKIKLDTIKNRALTIITGASIGTSKEVLGVALGILPLCKRRKELRLHYWTKTVTSTKNPAATAFMNYHPDIAS
jgi:hypothetical protein